MGYKEKYEQALERAKALYAKGAPDSLHLEEMFPELKEPEDEKTRKRIIVLVNAHGQGMYKSDMLAWLEKQSNEPNWCHHKVDLSGCSEEYRKAYYDGWNNCNQQHSQCKSEWNDVVKCLINGMKFYYEDNEEATWGTEKFSMKVKDILSWLEKQGEKFQYWKSSKEQLKALDCAYNSCSDTERGNYYEGVLETLIDDLRKLSEKQGEQKPICNEDERLLKLSLENLAELKNRFGEKYGRAGECICWLKSIKERMKGE